MSSGLGLVGSGLEPIVSSKRSVGAAVVEAGDTVSGGTGEVTSSLSDGAVVPKAEGALVPIGSGVETMGSKSSTPGAAVVTLRDGFCGALVSPGPAVVASGIVADAAVVASGAAVEADDSGSGGTVVALRPIGCGVETIFAGCSVVTRQGATLQGTVSVSSAQSAESESDTTSRCRVLDP
jgi:hypothetical protein